MSSTEIADSPQVQIVRSFCEAFKNRDMDSIAKFLHKDHRRITYPRSVGVPERTGEEYLQHTAKLMSLWIDSQASYINSNTLLSTKSPLQPTIHSIIEAPGGKVVTHVCISSIPTNLGRANAIVIP